MLVKQDKPDGVSLFLNIPGTRAVLFLCHAFLKETAAHQHMLSAGIEISLAGKEGRKEIPSTISGRKGRQPLFCHYRIIK